MKLTAPDSPHVRAFAALDLGEPLRQGILRLEHDLQARFARPSIRWVHPDLLHLTLLFFGNLPAHLVPPLGSALETACRGIGPFTLSLSGTGTFPDLRTPRILWAGVTGDLDPLRALQQRIAQASAPFAAPVDDRPFHPHLTIGRIRDRLDAPALSDFRNALAQTAPAALGSWTVDAAHLIRSELSPTGPKHTPLRRCPLT